MMQDLLSHTGASWVLIGVLAVVSIAWMWTKSKRSYTQYNIPPFPARPWPIFGHLFLLRGNVREKFEEWRNKAGDIFSFDIAGDHFIFLNSFDDIKEVMVKHADAIPNTQHNMGNDLLKEHDMGIIGARDNNWKEQRTTSLAILRAFGVGKNILAEKIQEEVSEFVEKLAAFKGKPEDIRLLTNISVSNVICSIIFGKRFEYDDPYFKNFMGHLNTVLQYLPNMSLVTSFPILYYVPGDPLNVRKWAKSAIETNEVFIKSYIKEFKKNFNENEEPQNFISAYLQEMKKKNDKKDPNKLDEQNLTAIVRTLFIAGTETTSTTILWCLIYILHHPEVQEKVYKEIETQVGTERVPTMADKSKLSYLSAVIMETQRFASLVPGAFKREIKSSFELRGFTFPKGSHVWPILDSVHFDKKIWGDPQNFRPERFIDKNGDLIHREELIPFSIGRRSCLGESLARMELYLFLSSLFQRFKFEPADKSGELPSITGVFGATVVPKPFQIRCVERK